MFRYVQYMYSRYYKHMHEYSKIQVEKDARLQARIYE